MRKPLVEKVLTKEEQDKLVRKVEKYFQKLMLSKKAD